MRIACIHAKSRHRPEKSGSPTSQDLHLYLRFSANAYSDLLQGARLHNERDAIQPRVIHEVLEALNANHAAPNILMPVLPAAEGAPARHTPHSAHAKQECQTLPQDTAC